MAHRGPALSSALRLTMSARKGSVRSALATYGCHARKNPWHLALRVLSSTSVGESANPEEEKKAAPSTRLVEAVAKSIARECEGSGPDLSKALQERGWNAEVVKLIFPSPSSGSAEELQKGLQDFWNESAEVESLVEMFEKCVLQHKHKGMLGYWIMDTLYPMGQWKNITFYQFSILVEDFRAVLDALGVKAGDNVAYLGRNSIEWAATAFAAWGLKAVFVPLYEEQTAAEWVHIINDSQAKVLLTGTKQLWDKIQPHKEGFATLEQAKMVCVDGVDGYLRWDDFGLTNKLKQVRGDVMGKPGKRTTVAVTPARLEDPAVRFYTSHGNMMSNVLARELVMPLQKKDVSMSFLPWSDPGGLAFELLGAMRSGTLVNIADGRGRLRRDIAESKPTLHFTTPSSLTVLKRQVDRDCEEKVYRWAWKLAIDSMRKQRAGDTSPLTSLFNRYFSRFVIRRVRPLLGGKLSHIIFSGPRPDQEDREFFELFGIRTTEMYYVTEAAGPVAFFPFRQNDAMEPDGTAVPSLNVGVADGQLHISGPSVAPKSELQDGWGSVEVSTGDLGVRAPDGKVRVTGRADHCFKLACGTEVSPTRIEDALIAANLIRQAVVCGEGKPCSVALVVPDYEKLQEAQKKRLGHEREQTEKQLLDDPRLKAMVDAEVEQVLSALKDSPEFAQEEKQKGIPGKFILLDSTLTIEDGTVAPAGAVRRSVVLAEQASAIHAVC
eukprot:CAMPEP_0177706644 /NCGR_PEP_ID=MMETSP0484_2-20121128/9334_1 /TAXON_ID=354590 /ORGANISM="Rhodomonas lens, Strain RHODO" /LENGTH=720 /DNA_ID=CAMNT_0019218117 /DNA_START=36 /DNA_END=2198 /DNA_ORIENTATION=+